MGAGPLSGCHPMLNKAGEMWLNHRTTTTTVVIEFTMAYIKMISIVVKAMSKLQVPLDVHRRRNCQFQARDCHDASPSGHRCDTSKDLKFL